MLGYAIFTQKIMKRYMELQAGWGGSMVEAATSVVDSGCQTDENRVDVRSRESGRVSRELTNLAKWDDETTASEPVDEPVVDDRMAAFRNESKQWDATLTKPKRRGERSKSPKTRRDKSPKSERRKKKKEHWSSDLSQISVQDHKALIAACEMVQKHWRGVRAQRVWVEMLEKAMDAEVDLDGLDLG